ncbi:MAG: phage baseplate assembly protein V [Gemmatimonadota bacterium]|nr:phage baseplate assembly protein V [Gemmatimonadota bacterium]
MAIRIDVKIGALALRDREIEHLEIKQAIGDHHRFSITFHRDPSKPLNLADFVNPPVTVTLTDDVTKKTAKAFVGVVSSCSEQHQLQGGSFFVVTALSDSAKFSARHHKGNFINATLQTIIKGFDDVKLGSSVLRERTADFRMAGLSDFEFLRRLADDHECFVRPLEKGIELRHGFDDNRHDLTFGKNLQSLTSRIVPKNNVFKGAYYEFQRKGEVALNDRTFDAVASGATELTDAVAKVGKALESGGVANIYETISRSSILTEFRDAMLRESERVSGGAVTIEGSSTNIELVVGDTVDIRAGSNFKLANPPGVVGLTELTHLFDGNQYINSFVATPWANYSSPVQPARELVFGLTTAEVVNNVDPLNLGRIQIRLKDSPQGRPELEQFARYITPFAGNGRGIAFLPEIGDEVIVGFEEGDPEHPYIIGSVWNGADVSPGAAPKRIVTKSGNAIVMDDNGIVEIHSPSGVCLVQLSNGVNGAARITIHSDGDLFLNAGDRIQLSCKNLVELVEKDATRIIKGDDQTSIKGSRFIEVAGADVHQSDQRIALLVGGSTAELSSAGVVLQGMNVVTLGSVQNVVSGGLTNINPPGFAMPPTQGSIFVEPETRDGVANARENPKPTQDFKVSREE